MDERLEAYDLLKRFLASSPSQFTKSKMADEHENEVESTGENNDGLTAKQRKNKKKKLAAKKKKQDQREVVTYMTDKKQWYVIENIFCSSRTKLHPFVAIVMQEKHKLKTQK